MWISVDDKFKPEVGKDYLVKTSEGYAVGYCGGCGWEPSGSVDVDYDKSSVVFTGDILEWFNKDLEEIQ